MDINRAQQIIESADTIAVQLNGEPVWIESVDKANNSVHVHMGNNPNNRVTVQADQLKEV